MTQPDPPKTFTDFIDAFPKLGEAWNKIHDAGQDGPLDDRTVRLVKLAIAVGAMREGAIRSSMRKAKAQGIEPEALAQVVALAAGTLGMPSTVAVYSWIRTFLDEE